MSDGDEGKQIVGNDMLETSRETYADDHTKVVELTKGTFLDPSHLEIKGRAIDIQKDFELHLEDVSQGLSNVRATYVLFT